MNGGRPASVRRLLPLIALTIVLPGIVVVALAGRGLLNERQQVERRLTAGFNTALRAVLEAAPG